MRLLLALFFLSNQSLDGILLSKWNQIGKDHLADKPEDGLFIFGLDCRFEFFLAFDVSAVDSICQFLHVSLQTIEFHLGCIEQVNRFVEQLDVNFSLRLDHLSFLGHHKLLIDIEVVEDSVFVKE